MNTNNILLPLVIFLGLVFFSSCTGDTVNEAENATTELVVNKVDSTEIKRLAAEAAAAKAAAEEEAKLEEERLAALEVKRKKAEKDSIRRAKRKLAKLKQKKAEEDRRKAEAEAAAAAEEVVVSQPVILPPSQPTTPPPSKPVATTPVKTNGAKIEFVKKNYEFGTIKEGDVVKYEFEYTNVGTEPLIIKDASATCGCTAPGFSFFPLEPGLSSAISVTFNSANKAGAQKPEVTIITNGYPSRHVLTMEGNVVK